MYRFLTRLLPLTVAACLLTACVTGSKTKQAADPLADVDPSILIGDVFTLPDQRDMDYALVKLKKEGRDAEALNEAVLNITVNDLVATLKEQAEQAAVVQATPAGWVIEARNLSLDGKAYAKVTVVVRREHYKIRGRMVSLAKLLRLILDGRDETVGEGWALYRDVVRHAVQQ